MAAAIMLLLISLGAIAAGVGYVRTAHRMRTFLTTTGTVVKRELAMVAAAEPEGRYGRGGQYRPKVTYTYSVGGTPHTSDKVSYAHRGLKKALAEEALAATPDEVTVYYNPAAPGEAYLERHVPRLGYYLVAGGAIGCLFALLVFVV